MRSAVTALTLIVIIALGCIAYGCTQREATPTSHIPIAHSPLEFTLTDIGGKAYPLDQHAGKVLLLVNVASQCAFTKQYAALQALHVRYRERGLVVIGIPANDFFGQEPGAEAEIQTFCSTTYGVTFPMMAKVGVRGDDICPLYQHLTTESAKPGKIGWNFVKFLVGRHGQVVERFGSTTAPDDPKVIAAIESALVLRQPAVTSP